jgi:hypothetical protein
MNHYMHLIISKFPILAAATMCISLSGCIQDEPLNSECDIEMVSIHLDNPLGTFFNASDTLQTLLSTDSVVTFNVRRNHADDLTTIKPIFKLTSGATIKELGNSVNNTTGGSLRYIVTSEDGLWHRSYTVNITPVVRTVVDTIKYDFENFELEPSAHKYYIWHNEQGNGSFGNGWANGNPGFRLSRGTARPDEYPTTPLPNSFDGYGVKLTTCDTGPFGQMVNKRIAAGNLFLGAFNLASALSDALRATHFGIPFDRKPVMLKGYYKYKPGQTYQDRNGNPVSGTTDKASIYAVFYKNHDNAGNSVMLDGTNIKTSPLVIAIADMGFVTPTDSWTEFTIPFNYTGTVDANILQSLGYNLTVVFSSSLRGDQFEGAIGSTLCIDKVRVVCESEQ